MLDDVSAFVQAISESLRAGCIRKNKMDVGFRSDSFKFLFSDTGTGAQYNLVDFDNRYFKDGWNRFLSKTGEGFEVDFPVVLIHKVKWANNGYHRVDDKYVNKNMRSSQFKFVKKHSKFDFFAS